MPSSKLPKYEDWKSPWEEKGEELNADKVRKLLYNILLDKETLQGRVTETESQRDAVQAKLDEIVRKDESDQDRLKREKEDLERKLAASDPNSPERRALVLEIALDKGLTKKQADRLRGTTKDEIEADADDLLESIGSNGSRNEEDGDEPPRRIPQRLRTPGDPGNGGDDDGDISVADALTKVNAGRLPF